MNLDTLISEYGYLAILVGTFLEGETILVLGAVAARLGYLELPWVVASAFIGTLAGDQLYFFLGRYHGQALLARHPRWRRRASKAQRLLERHRVPVIIGFRFLYGIRNVTPFVIGMSRVPVPEFVLLNLIGAALWASVVAGLGYAFGEAAVQLVDEVKHYEGIILGAVLVIGATLWWFYWRGRKRNRPADHARRSGSH